MRGRPGKSGLPGAEGEKGCARPQRRVLREAACAARAGWGEAHGPLFTNEGRKQVLSRREDAGRKSGAGLGGGGRKWSECNVFSLETGRVEVDCSGSDSDCGT